MNWWQGMQSYLAGVGWKMDQELTAMGVVSAADLRGVPLATLTKTFGERTAKYMYGACRGEVWSSFLAISACLHPPVT